MESFQLIFPRFRKVSRTQHLCYKLGVIIQVSRLALVFGQNLWCVKEGEKSASKSQPGWESGERRSGGEFVQLSDFIEFILFCR